MASKTAAGAGGGSSDEKEKEKEKNQHHNVQIPTHTSPYVQYTDLEDYKLKAYGFPGHLSVVDRPHHGGGTDAPTLSGGSLPERHPPQSHSHSHSHSQ